MTRVDVPPVTASDGLAHDTELLSAALNSVLEEQAGRVFASRVQWLFRTAAAIRAGDDAAIERLVANIAEERERVRRLRQYDRTGEIQRESLAETARILRDRPIDIAALTA